MITKDLIKGEIDKVQDEYLPALYRIVRALEPASSPATSNDRQDWRSFIAETYGSTAAAPLERGKPTVADIREPME